MCFAKRDSRWIGCGVFEFWGWGWDCSKAAIATFPDLATILFAQLPFSCGGITLHQGETKVIRRFIFRCDNNVIIDQISSAATHIYQ